MLKLYVVVRNDIGVPFQMCQVAHAVANFATEYRQAFADWNLGNNTICVLQTPSGDSLTKLVETARDGGFKHTTFYEPDWQSMGYENEPVIVPKDGWLTAVAFAPNWTVQNVLLADLPLALNQKTVENKVGFSPNHKAIAASETIVNAAHYEYLRERNETLERLESGRGGRKAYFKVIDKVGR